MAFNNLPGVFGAKQPFSTTAFSKSVPPQSLGYQPQLGTLAPQSVGVFGSQSVVPQSVRLGVLPGQTQPVVHQSSQPFSVGLGQLAPNNPHWSGFRPDGGHGVFQGQPQPSAGYYPQLGTLAPQSIGITGPRPAQSLGGPWDGFNRDGTTNHPGGNVQSWGNQGIGSASAYVASPPPGSVTGLGPWSNAPVQSLGGPWDGFNRDGTTNQPGPNVPPLNFRQYGSVANDYVDGRYLGPDGLGPGGPPVLGPGSNGKSKNKKSKQVKFESGGKSLVAKKPRGRPRKTEKK